jgi:hypothetical protein
MKPAFLNYETAAGSSETPPVYQITLPCVYSRTLHVKEIFAHRTYYICVGGEIIHGTIPFCGMGLAYVLMRDVNMVLELEHRWVCLPSTF